MSYTLHRTAAALVTLAFASVIIFFFIHLIPGDPLYVLLGDVATPDQVERLRSKLALDQPMRQNALTRQSISHLVRQKELVPVG